MGVEGAHLDQWSPCPVLVTVCLFIEDGWLEWTSSTEAALRTWQIFLLNYYSCCDCLNNRSFFHSKTSWWGNEPSLVRPVKANPSLVLYLREDVFDPPLHDLNKSLPVLFFKLTSQSLRGSFDEWQSCILIIDSSVSSVWMCISLTYRPKKDCFHKHRSRSHILPCSSWYLLLLCVIFMNVFHAFIHCVPCGVAAHILAILSFMKRFLHSVLEDTAPRMKCQMRFFSFFHSEGFQRIGRNHIKQL